MDDDFNTANLVTYLLDLVKELNTKIRAKEDFVEIYDKVMLANYILGLEYDFVTLSDEDKDIYNKWLEYIISFPFYIINSIVVYLCSVKEKWFKKQSHLILILLTYTLSYPCKIINPWRLLGILECFEV